MLEYLVEAELANKRRQFERSFRAGHQIAGARLLQRFRNARRSRATRFAPRYESDGSLTRQLKDRSIGAATHL
jgi:hypothetical protein